jgi:hypothetical protein
MVPNWVGEATYNKNCLFASRWKKNGLLKPDI